MTVEVSSLVCIYHVSLTFMPDFIFLQFYERNAYKSVTKIIINISILNDFLILTCKHHFHTFCKQSIACPMMFFPSTAT